MTSRIFEWHWKVRISSKYGHINSWNDELINLSNDELIIAVEGQDDAYGQEPLPKNSLIPDPPHHSPFIAWALK